MTERERQAYRELLERLQTLTCRTHTLLSDCKDADGRVIADERTVRMNVLSGVHDLCRWCGLSGAAVEANTQYQWRRFSHDDHPPMVLPVRTVTTESKDPDVAMWREAFWDGHWIELSRIIDYGWQERGPGQAIPPG